MPKLKLPPQVLGVQVKKIPSKGNKKIEDFVLQIMLVAYIHKKGTKKGKHTPLQRQYDILLPLEPKPRVIETYIKDVSEKFREFLNNGEYIEYDLDKDNKPIMTSAKTKHFNDWVIFDMKTQQPVESKDNKHNQVTSNLKEHEDKIKKTVKEIK